MHHMPLFRIARMGRVFQKEGRRGGGTGEEGEEEGSQHTSKETAEYKINQAKSAVRPRNEDSSRFLEYRLMKKMWNMKSRLSGPK